MRMVIVRYAARVFALATAAGFAAHGAQCSNAALRGQYSFTAKGNTLAAL